MVQEKSENRRTFAHIPSSIGALEAEEIGVEHLLRDIRVGKQISTPSLHAPQIIS